MKITERLRQLSIAVADQNWREFSMRVPAEPDRDADIVIMQAAMLIESRDAEVAELRNLPLVKLLKDSEHRSDQLSYQVMLLRDALTESRRELDSCQKVIWLASDYGFDPAYVKVAQASIRKTDEALYATEPKL